MSDVTIEPPMDAKVIGADPASRRDFAGSLGAAARDNPAAAALVAMGAVWLFAGGSRVTILGTRRGRRSARADYQAADPAPSVTGMRAEGAAAAAEDAARGVGQASRHAGRMAEDLGARAASASAGAADAVADGAGALVEGLSSAARRTGSAVSEAGTATSQAVRRTAGSAWDGAEDVGRSVREMLEDQPLAIAALGLAAGAGLAWMLPRTQTEQALMGEQSEALRDHAQSAAMQGLRDVRESGEAIVARAVQDARARGLTEEAVRAAVEEFTAKLGKVALAARDATGDEVVDGT